MAGSPVFLEEDLKLTVNEEERGGAALGTEVPGLQRDRAARKLSCGAELERFKGRFARSCEAARTQRRGDDRDLNPLLAGLDQLLPAGRGSVFGGPRRVGAASTALSAVATVEARLHSRAKLLHVVWLANVLAERHQGRGPWWNAGASHMNEAFPTSFTRMGLVSLVDTHRRLQVAS